MAASFKDKFRGKETPESELLVSIIKSIAHGVARLGRRLDKRMPPSESKDLNLNWADIDSKIQKAAEKLVSVNEKAHMLAGAMKFLDGEATQKILLDGRKQDLDNKKIRDLEQKAMAVAEEHRQSLEKLRAEHAKEMAAQMEDKTKMLSVIVENEKRLLEQLEEMETEIEQRQKEKDLLVDKVIRLRSRDSRFMDKLEEKRRQIKEMKKEKRQMKEREAAVGEHLARTLAILAADEKSQPLPPVREEPDLEELELEARLQLHATARDLMAGREPQPIPENFPPPRH